MSNHYNEKSAIRNEYDGTLDQFKPPRKPWGYAARHRALMFVILVVLAAVVLLGDSTVGLLSPVLCLTEGQCN